MANENENKSRNLLDTKYGTFKADSFKMNPGKNDKEFATATLVCGDKEFTVYGHGKKAEELKAKVEAGEATFVMGELIAKGRGISASRFEPATYDVTVTEVKKEGDNEGTPWATMSIQREGKDKPTHILVTGDEVARLKAAKDSGETISVDVAWTAAKYESGDWGTSAVTANNLIRTPAAPEAKKEDETPDPTM